MKKKTSGGRRNPVKGAAAPRTVDEYLAGVPEPARATLGRIRAAIRSAAPPEATETISYRIPAFKYRGMLVWFAAFSGHCSFFPTSSVVRMFKEELRAYPTSKGTIRFPMGKPPPIGLIKRMVKARVAQNEGKIQR